MVTVDGITLRSPSVMNSVQDTTACSPGSRLRETMVCSASTICEAITIGSMPICGRAACVPRPRISITKLSSLAMMPPARVAKLPAGMPGMLCAPKIASTGKRSNRPVGHHRLGAAPVFLRRLEHEAHDAVEVAPLGQQLRRAEHHRHMAVVTAGVHLARHARGMGTARRLLDDVQRIHLRADRDRALAAAGPQVRHQPRAADAAMHLQPERAENARHRVRGADLLVARFRVLMKLPAPAGQLVLQGAFHVPCPGYPR